MLKFTLDYLSLAHSFMLQVKNGHGKDAVPDHRIDVHGALTEAELCCNYVNLSITKKIRTIRKELTEKNFTITLQDLEKINAIYLFLLDKADKSQIDIVNKITESPQNTIIEKKSNQCGCKK